jgi:glycosyltransferase involved in cell wall biosynthesis
MPEESIICFAKDWEESPTSNHHVMRELSRHHDVVWLNSVSTRAPRLQSPRDLRKIARKLAQFTSGPKQVDDRMWVFTPLVLPLPHQSLCTEINRELLRMTMRWLKERLHIERFQLWTFLPSTADYVGAFGETLVVYYVVDEWSLFSYVDGARIAEADRRLCRSADVVFGVTDSLVDARRELNPRTYLAPHGVDHGLFRRALEPEPLPDDVALLKRPILGFYGTIQDWVDQRLIAFLAARHPDWSFVLIGSQLVDTSLLDQFDNVHLLGPRAHDALPDYCRAFSVGLIPYVVEERMRFVNPLKLREYLSAGLPVVSTAVPESQRYEPDCRVAHDFEAFEKSVEQAIERDCPEERHRRSEMMRQETWSSRVEQIRAQVTAALMEKERCKQNPAIA